MTVAVAGAFTTSSSNFEAVTTTWFSRPICKVASSGAVSPASTLISLKVMVLKPCASTLTV